MLGLRFIFWDENKKKRDWEKYKLSFYIYGSELIKLYMLKKNIELKGVV